MRTYRAYAAALVFALGLGACASHWYGYPRDEWRRLSAEEQAAARQEYQFIIDQREAQKHQDLIDERKQSIIDYGSSVQKPRNIRP